MKLLFVSATALELKPLLKLLQQAEDTEEFFYQGHEISVLNTGVGMTATAFALGNHLAQKSYDLAINIGLAGAFSKALSLGEVVHVVSDFNGEEGVEDGDAFIPLISTGLRSKDDFPFTNGMLKASPLMELQSDIPGKEVKGISVNKVHGNERSIELLLQQFNPDVESMEGSAFFYSCLMNKVPCVQLRAISNYVERRNKDAWEIELALNNLAHAIKTFIDKQ